MLHEFDLDWFDLDMSRLDTFTLSREIPPFTRTAPSYLQIREEADHFIVTVALPGARPDNIQIETLGRFLYIRAERKSDCPDEVIFLKRERVTGYFIRTIQMPEKVIPDDIEWVYLRGLITIRLLRSV
jgi:HSP20 family protein